MMKEVQTGKKDDEGSRDRKAVIIWFQKPNMLYSLAKKLASFCLYPENLNQEKFKKERTDLFGRENFKIVWHSGFGILLFALGHISSESEQETKPKGMKNVQSGNEKGGGQKLGLRQVWIQHK